MHGPRRCLNGTCSCQSNYIGADCSIRTCPNSCHGHGYCLKGFCVCKPGWKGADCGVQACPNECNAHGRCVNSSCACDAGWTGDACDAHTCPSDCSAHGLCDGKTGMCKCDLGYKGADCSVAPEAPRECGPTCVTLCLRQCKPCAKEGSVVQRACYAKCTDSCQDVCGRNVDPTTMEAFKSKEGFCPKTSEEVAPSDKLVAPTDGAGEEQ